MDLDKRQKVNREILCAEGIHDYDGWWTEPLGLTRRCMNCGKAQIYKYGRIFNNSDFIIDHNGHIIDGPSGMPIYPMDFTIHGNSNNNNNENNKENP